ncbi:centrosomal protein of 57 kda [Plakobranchus ocellatus]|uniref:Centrosomal protein of 57 kDa n=1 Tax=Plakobranchus ocellatus TaxID=259542 RepID=A0AAV4DGA2_9GAST|nr:centrosomal protein of 57 kda [Plakobranchus ocellatus]
MDDSDHSEEAGTQGGYSVPTHTYGDFTSQQEQKQRLYGEEDYNHNGQTLSMLQPMASMAGETTASTKYLDYPTDRPFLNSDFPKFTGAGTATTAGSTTRPKAVNTYPISDRDAVISALRNLQDKVKKLELERTEAEQNLHTLASETEQYKEMLNHDKTTGKGKQFTFGSYMQNGDGYAAHQAKELEGQLTSAENRCRLLEQQLDHMRTMVHKSEQNRRELMERTARARQEKEQAVLASGAKPGMGTADVTSQVDRLNELERDQMRLTATQTLAESTSASHSLGANVQKVLAMMKSHNKALCSSHPWSHQRPGSPSSSCSSSTGENTESSSGVQDLGELLAQLQDEFGYLCSQQQEVMTQLHEAHSRGDFRLQTDLEAKLDTLVSRMEAKSGQISKIRQHQQKLENGKKPKSVLVKTGMKSKRPHSAGTRPTSSSTVTTNGHHQYSHNHYQNNNINGNERPKAHSCNKPIGHSALGKPALFMLRDMKKLQSTLRKDDLAWE